MYSFLFTSLTISNCYNHLNFFVPRKMANLVSRLLTAGLEKAAEDRERISQLLFALHTVELLTTDVFTKVRLVIKEFET